MEANLINGLNLLFVLIFSLSVHEWAHAYSASLLGDNTAKKLGRLSLNPLVHVDFLGTIVLPMVGFFTGGMLFGWAKPVPVDLAKLRRGRVGHALVSGAGPGANIVLAAGAFFLLWGLVSVKTSDYLSTDGAIVGSFVAPLELILTLAVKLNLILAVLNLIPLSPLDGGAVLKAFLPDFLARFIEKTIDPFGFFILLALLMSGVLWPLFNMVSRATGELLKFTGAIY